MSKRRAKGDGSVYTRKDGRVVGEWDDANGKTRYMTSKTMTKREMSKAVRKKLQDRDEGIAAHSEGLTVEKYMDRWLEAIRGNVVQHPNNEDKDLDHIKDMYTSMILAMRRDCYGSTDLTHDEVKSWLTIKL